MKEGARTVSHLALGQESQALKLYHTLADSKAYLALGLYALQRGRWEESISHLSHALKNEADCSFCADALKNAEAARIAHDEIVKARLIRNETTPGFCLCYLAMITAGSMLSSGVLHPKLRSIGFRVDASG
jgi:hypothetical protein